jgi:hypothetical protein
MGMRTRNQGMNGKHASPSPALIFFLKKKKLRKEGRGLRGGGGGGVRWRPVENRSGDCGMISAGFVVKAKAKKKKKKKEGKKGEKGREQRRGRTKE